MAISASWLAHQRILAAVAIAIANVVGVPWAFAGDAPMTNDQPHYACPAELRIVYPDTYAPPFINGSGSKIPDDPGLLVEWARAAVTSSPCHVKLSFFRLPTVRSQLEINIGRYDVMLVVTDDNPMVSKLRFPMQAEGISSNKMIGHGALMLYVLPGSAANWDGVTLSLPKPGTVGVVRGQVSQFVATQNGWDSDESPDTPTNFRKLQLGRVAAVLEQKLVATDLIKTLPAADQNIQMLPVPVKTISYYSPVTTTFYQRYPEFSEQFWLDICIQSRKVWKNLPKCTDK